MGSNLLYGESLCIPGILYVDQDCYSSLQWRRANKNVLYQI